MKKLILILFCSFAFTQTKLEPTEVEALKLAKTKAQLATVSQSVETIKAQIQLYQAQQYFLEQQRGNKQAELDKLVEEVKKAHKDWIPEKDISYNSQEGESGSFTKTEPKKDEKK